MQASRLFIVVSTKFWAALTRLAPRCRRWCFTPIAGAPGSTATTTFHLVAKSSGYLNPIGDNVVSVIDIDAVAAPTIGGTVGGQSTTFEAPVKPFASVTIGDRNSGATEVAGHHAGRWWHAGRHRADRRNGSYQLTGTAASVTSALDALVFTAALGPPLAGATTRFTLTDKSSAAATVTTDSTASVIDSDSLSLFVDAAPAIRRRPMR